jgi:hypothetical protein
MRYIAPRDVRHSPPEPKRAVRPVDGTLGLAGIGQRHAAEEEREDKSASGLLPRKMAIGPHSADRIFLV